MDRPAGSWIASARETAPETGGGPVSGATLGTVREPARGFEQAVLDAELGNVRRATEGSRNATLNQAAFNLAQVMPVDAWHSELMSAAVAAGLGRTEAANTIKSAMAGAARNPRTAARMPGNGPVRPVETLPGVDAYLGPDQPPAGFERINWADLWADLSVQEWLCEPLLPVGALVSLYSPPGVGKSLLTLDVAVAIARGTEVLGVQCRQARVLYLDYENTDRQVRDRLQEMRREPEDLQDLVYLSFPVHPHLDTPEGGQALLEAARWYGAALVVIDTVARAIGGDENDAKTWNALYQHTLMPLKREGITVLRIDHSGKDESKGQRGSSAKSGDVDMVWRLDVLVDDESYVLINEKHRMQLSETRLTVRRVAEPLTHQVDTRTAWSTKVQAVMEAADAARLPLSAGRDLVRKACEDAGVKVGTDQLRKIVKERQDRGLPDLS